MIFADNFLMSCSQVTLDAIVFGSGMFTLIVKMWTVIYEVAKSEEFKPFVMNLENPVSGMLSQELSVKWYPVVSREFEVA